MKITAEFNKSTELFTFIQKMGTDAARKGGARGLNEHTEWQRKNAVASMAAITGVPKGYVSGRTRATKARPSPSMVARVVTKAPALSYAKFGRPVWDKSSGGGVTAHGWNKAKTFKGAFWHGGHVLKRTGKERYPLKVYYAPVLSSELATATHTTARQAEVFARHDLKKRVLRHTMVALGL